MSTAVAAGLLVVLIGVRLRPRPTARRPSRATETTTPPSTSPMLAETRASRWRVRRGPVEVTPAEVGAWCEALARATRTGSTLSDALRNVDAPSSCRPTIDAVSLALARGQGLSVALDVRDPSPHLTLALGVLHACASHGGSPAEPLDRAASTLRARALAESERATHSAQARLSAVVMTVTPGAMLALLLATSSTTRLAVATPLGLLVVAFGVALNLLGWRWMRRLIVSGMR